MIVNAAVLVVSPACEWGGNRQGDEGDRMFIVEEGTLEVIIDGEVSSER